MNRTWGEIRSAGEFGQGSQSVIAEQRAGFFLLQFPGTYGVDGNLSVLGALDRIFEGDAAGVVLAIADDDQNLRDGLHLRATRQFVGCEGNRIPKRSTARRYELIDCVGNHLLVAGEILNDEYGVGDSDY